MDHETDRPVRRPSDRQTDSSNRFDEFLHECVEMEDGLSELAGIVEEAVDCGFTDVVKFLFSSVDWVTKSL